MKQRNYPTNHVSHKQIGAVTNHDDGTCSFQLDTIPEKGLRTIDVFQGKHRLFSISISDTGVCYQVLQAGQDKNLFTLWEDDESTNKSFNDEDFDFSGSLRYRI